jgi:hypothetical protein
MSTEVIKANEVPDQNRPPEHEGRPEEALDRFQAMARPELFPGEELEEFLVWFREQRRGNLA